MTTPDVFRDAEYIADVSDIPVEGDGHGVALAGQRAGTARQEFTKKAQATAKIAFIDRLLRDLDIVIYCELSALYYMDCSVVMFAARAVVQLIFFTPKAPPFEPTRNQPFIGAIFFSNLFCVLLHLLSARPEAGEATRGYLHGGLFIDFIGQKGPVSKFRLVTFDLLIMALHLVMLGLVLERVETMARRSLPQEPRSDQDHDAEERGVLRRDSGEASTRSTGDDVEPDEISFSNAHTGMVESLERTELLAEPSEESHREPSKDSHALDTFLSGEAVIMDMSVVDTILDQWRYNPATMYGRTSGYVPSNETTTFLRERLGLEVGPDGRVVRVGR